MHSNLLQNKAHANDPENSYDEMPYESKAFPQTNPTHLSAIGNLFGLELPEFRTMRVLEIGCASGGNLIPLAAAYPDGKFTGVDISKTQIEDGKRRIEEQKLKNIDLINIDILKFPISNSVFDFVICHGVYSWVPKRVRRAIFDVCSKCLKPSGVAYISYNVLPGWRARQFLRDALLTQVGHIGGLKQRTASAREFMRHLAEHALPGPYGELINRDLKSLQQAGDDYLAHEFLERHNSPCTFKEFIQSATSYHLSYLGESEFSTMIPRNINANFLGSFREKLNQSIVDLETCIDIFSGRMFRQTLLVPCKIESKINRRVSKQAVMLTHLIGNIREIQSKESAYLFCFKNARGRNFYTNSDLVREVLLYISKKTPSSANYKDIVEHLESIGIIITSSEEREICRVIYDTISTGFLIPISESINAGSSSDLRPRVSRLSQIDALNGRSRTVNLRHENYNMNNLTRSIVSVLDGTRSRADLVGFLESVLFKERGSTESNMYINTCEVVSHHELFDIVEKILKDLHLNAMLCLKVPYI